MSWLWLLLAGGCEIVGVIGFERLTRGRHVRGLIVCVLGFGVALTCLRLALADLPMAVAYGVFTGIGALGSALVGIVCWGDDAGPARLGSIGLIVAGVIGLKLAGSG